MKAPTLATYEEFIAHWEKDTDSFKMTVFSQYQFACKERDRLRAKDKRNREKKRNAIPVNERKPRGRPRKNPPPETTAPGSDFPA